ncbi:MAG: PQQ-dependent sugar dehydrogenase [Planctomycetes bacterium]|nr:PQQ-dependent sugar dehydrogenase [Planctomycetota bacterium]
MRLTHLVTTTATALISLALLAPLAPAQTIRSTLVASGFARPVNLVQPPGETNRLFVTEQFTGNIKIIKNGAVLATPYLTISPLTTGNEQGLLGLAFHPNFQTNGKFYVNYTTTGGVTNLRQYVVPVPSADVASPSSNTLLLSITQPESNHNGGCIQFGPDGFLYMGQGDGGGGCDGHGTNGNGQALTTYLGKMLRIDVDNAPTYVPAGNPFPASSFPLIWSYGLRNPWRFSFDKLTGDIYIGDVGQNAVEEIDFEPVGTPGGRNYGWRCFEGNSCSSASGCLTSPCSCVTTGLVFPIQTYTHSTGLCLTGGFVYRGANVPGLVGTYFYADYSTNRIWSFRYTVGGGLTNFTDRTTQLDPAGAPTITQVTTFGQDNAGEVYIVEQGGEIWRIDGVPPGSVTCPGDGSLSIDCPCSNIGLAGHGCANSANAQGALLGAVGDTTSDSVRLDSAGMPTTTSCIFLKGDAIDLNGANFGDGLICVSGSLIRLRTKIAAGGAASFPDSTDTITLSARGGTPPGSGLTAYYQTYYRNASATFCPPETFNITNGYQIVW